MKTKSKKGKYTKLYNRTYTKKHVNRYTRKYSKNVKGAKNVKGGAFLASAALKNPKLVETALASGRMGPSIKDQTINKMNHFDEEHDIKYYFKKGMYALYKIMSSLVTLPIRNLDEVIPPELCKKMTGNKFVCSQSMLQYVLTGTKPDYKKILLEKDEKNCLSFDEDGNKIIKCKNKDEGQTGGNIHKQRGGMIIGCEKKPSYRFNTNDRVIVILDETDKSDNLNSGYVELNDKQWFIGTVTTVTKDNYVVQIDNGSVITRNNSVTEDIMQLYHNDWKDFYKEFYNMPKIVLQDLYDIGYTIGHPFIKRLNIIFKIIYEKSGIYTIVKLFSFLAKNIWQSFKSLVTLDNKNVFIKSINNLVNNYKELKIDYIKDRGLQTKIIFINIVMVYDRYLNGKSIDQTLELLDDNSKRLQVAVGKKLRIIEERLIRFNLYLRKYECPMSKLESLISSVYNIELLEKMLSSCNILLGENNYKDMEGDEKEQRKNRIEECDSKFNYNLNIIPDSTNIDFNVDIDKMPSSCQSCSSNKWAEIVVRYGCLFSKAINGSRNNMTYILINIVEEMATLNNDDPDPIIGNIKEILQNIECRSNLRGVIEKRIKLLKGN